MTKATIEKRTPVQVDLKIIVTKDELQGARTAVLADAKKGLKVAGFRPGQAPDAIAERQLDQAKFQMDVMEKILAATFSEAVKGHELRTLAQPKIDITKFVPFDELEYTAQVAVLPQIDYDYAKLRVKYTEPKLDEAEVDLALNNLREQAGERNTVKRAAKDGDELRLDFVGERDGKPFEGGSAQNAMIVIGSGRLIPGFEDELIGLKAGEKKSFDITFPKDYQNLELAGQKTTFKITVHEVREVKLPKLDDAFVKELGNFTKLADLKEDIRKNLREGKIEEIRRAYEAEVLAAAVKNSKVEFSPLLIDEQIEDLRREYQQQVKQQGLELESWLKIQKKSEADFEADLKVEATRRVGIGLIIRDIIDKQKLKVSVEDVDAQIETMRQTYSDPEVLSHLDHDHFKNDVANRLITQKAVDWLCTNAKGGK